MKEENLDEKVPVRAYTKADLAMLYNPGVCITTALQLLRRWIYANRQLMAELKEAGYNKKDITQDPPAILICPLK